MPINQLLYVNKNSITADFRPKIGSCWIRASCGLVAQWITRPPTERKIPGSTPGKVDVILTEELLMKLNVCLVSKCHVSTSITLQSYYVWMQTRIIIDKNPRNYSYH